MKMGQIISSKVKASELFFKADWGLVSQVEFLALGMANIQD